MRDHQQMKFHFCSPNTSEEHLVHLPCFWAIRAEVLSSLHDWISCRGLLKLHIFLG